MKKAKQLLSLMLVIVMALGMMTFTTGTASAKNVSDYSDSDSIEYVEAVDVLTALGVLTGDETGTFGPQGNITREQAAKIITYLLIGTTSADRLTSQKSSFTDVAQDRWSNPYIEYCASRGIILGYGDGRFGPADPVTGSQMAKMLLFVIGYGGKQEYTGERWELNTIVDGQKRGILTLDEDYTKPATREQVAQYAFNALHDYDAYLVTYNTLIDEYVTFGSQNPFSPVKATYLREETFGLYPDTTGVDPLGYRTRIWRLGSTVNAKAITGEYRADSVLARSVDSTEIIGTDANMTAGQGLTDLGSYNFKAELRTYYNDNNVEQPLQVFRNGTLVGSYTQAQLTDGTFAASQWNALSYKRGVVVDLVDRDKDGHCDKIVFIEKTVSVVTANPMVNAFGSTTINGVLNATGGYTFSAGKVAYPEELKAGDVVLYYRDNDKSGAVTHVEIAKSESGVMQSYTPNLFAQKYANISLGGKTYYPTGLAGSLAEPYETFTSYATNNNYYNYGAIVFLDDGGSVIAVTPEEEGELDYLALLDVNQSGYATQAEAVLADGTYKIITIGSLSKDNVVHVTAAALAANLVEENVYSYSVNADGSFALRAESNAALAPGAIISQRASFATGLVGDASTVFVVEVTNGDGSISYNRYVGVSNAPVFNADTNILDLGYAVARSGMTKFVFLKGTPASLQTNSLMFYSASSYTEIREGNLSRYIYDVVDTEGAEGVTRKVTLTQDAHNSINGYYFASGLVYSAVQASVSYDSNGRVTSAVIPGFNGAPNASMFTHYGILANASNGVVSFNGGSYRYSSATKVFILTGDLFVPVVAGTIQDVVADTNAIVFGRVSTGTGTTDLITELFVQRRTTPGVASQATTINGTADTTKLGDVLAQSFAVKYDNGTFASAVAMNTLNPAWVADFVDMAPTTAPTLNGDGTLQAGTYYFTLSSGFYTAAQITLVVA